MISKTKFLANIDAIAAEKPSYQLGHDGSDGKCDCIGLIIGAIRRSGEKWTGTHGSNYAARNEMQYLLPINNVNDLSVGEIVYKAATPGASNYNLPSRYDGHSDRNDYYHVGVVRSVSPLKIVHCTGPGIVYDTKLGKWSYRGWLKKVDCDDIETTNKTGDDQMPTAYGYVTSENGKSVNFRAAPNTKAARITRYPELNVGTRVEVLGTEGEWTKIKYDSHTGYMQSKFITSVQDEDSGEPTSVDQMITQIKAAINDLLIMVNTLETQI